MRVFNLAEELEKERKKNKELKNKVDFLIDRNDKKQEVIDKAVEIIKKYGYEKQMKEDYLMDRVNLANYNCLLLDILKGDNK